MSIIFFSYNQDMISEWSDKYKISDYISCYDLTSLFQELQNMRDYTLIADYDSVAHDINKIISSNKLPEYTVVLEREPEIVIGKMLIKHGVRAYGNSRMLQIHFEQLLNSVQDGKTWTYPELTAALIKNTKSQKLDQESLDLIQNRLTPQEIVVIHMILDGYTNDAIANQLEITTRTVKAHVSSIFSKLHVSDRVSLVLLLK